MTLNSSISPSIFREYDIRGVVDETLHAAHAPLIAAAYASMVKEKGGKKICIGFDGRESSPILRDQFIKGLRASGLDVIELPCGPTPMLYFSVLHYEADGGVMITGSHNPSNHNGFKFMLGRESLHGAGIQEIYKRLATSLPAHEKEGSLTKLDAYPDYLKRLLEGIYFDRNLTIVWDAGNGAMGEAMARATKSLPGLHILLNEKIDGAFPAHHPDPSDPKNMRQLQEAVAQQKADLGIAFDGDGDRIGIVDDAGDIWAGDQILLYLAEDLARRKPGSKIIADVKCSQVLFDRIKELGGQPIMWKTGHSLIKAKMKEEKAPLAGEMSGHIFLGEDYYGFDDALLAALRLAVILSKSKQKLSEWQKSLPQLASTPEYRFPCDDARKFAVVEEVRSRLAADKASFVGIDGVRVLRPEGWWLLRVSNTQPLLVARAEGIDAKAAAILLEDLGSQLQQSGVKLPRE
ncbi:MAG: phosphoglucomutase/phosphomannomutase PgmG [Dongiaceae bacterium]